MMPTQPMLDATVATMTIAYVLVKMLACFVQCVLIIRKHVPRETPSDPRFKD